MKRFYLILVALVVCISTFAQEITVRFTGMLNDTAYQRFDSVKVTNLTRDWTETIFYPDTIVVLGGNPTFTEESNLQDQGLSQNVPNPFDCETKVELTISKTENVGMMLIDLNGRVYAEFSGQLEAGTHTFDISAATSQTYMLNAVAGSKTYSIRMVNVGSGCNNFIKYAGTSNVISAKLSTTNEFVLGDNMEYVGYAFIDGNVVPSEIVSQPQVVNQHITLHFTYIFKPQVVTVAATDIRFSSAIINGSVIFDGGAEITSCGFYYGTSTDDLSNVVQSALVENVFSSLIENLAENTTYYYCAFAISSAGVGIGEVQTFATTQRLIPNIETIEAENVSVSSAKISGNIISDGEAEITSYGFYYGTSANELSNTLSGTLDSANYFSSMLENLTDGTTYYYCAYAENAVGTGYGDTLTFTTIPMVIPTVETAAAENVSATGAKLKGNVVYDGEAEITSYGFYYGTSANELSNTLSETMDSANYFSGMLENLADGTTYYYCAYAENAVGIGYGDTLTFTTLNIVAPTVETIEAEGIIATGAKLKGNLTYDGGDEITSYGFYYGTSADNLSNVVSATMDSASYFSVRVENLLARTTYYYCAFASNRIGYGVGEVLSFTTDSVTIPIVATSLPTISATNAVFNGSVISDGGAEITSCGFYYGTSSDELSSTISGSLVNADFSGLLDNLSEGTTYYYCAFAGNVAGIGMGDTLSFRTESHGYVDLGLPSGTLWATCNLGASTPEGYGDFYAWGETSAKNSYTSSNYTYTGSSVLPLSADAANVNWGSNWRMPTYDELYELNANCTVTWTSRNGIRGRLFVGSNGNSIFLPAAGTMNNSNNDEVGSAGYYRSSTPSTGSYARYLYFSSSSCYMNTSYRYSGHSIRAVRIPNDDTSATLPTVVTGNATNVTTTSATLNGEITGDGNDEIIARGFVYGTSPTNLSIGEQCGVGTGRYSVDIAGLVIGITYYYRAYATNNVGTAYGNIKTFETVETQLNGHDYVDLGLPSGTLWSTCNVGADTPEGYGDYFAWGETSAKSNYNWNTYSWCNGSSSTLTKYCNNSSYGYNGFTDNLLTLDASDDAATANWGSAWRMPTYDELNELMTNCTITWTTQNGVNGQLFTGTNGNSIFLPAAGDHNNSSLNSDGYGGRYWSSSIDENHPYYAWYLRFASDYDCYMYDYGQRYSGHSVRPVLATNAPTVTTYTVTFDANGGSGTMLPQTFREGMAQTLRANTFTRTNYTFAGWNTDANGSGTAYTNGQSITISANMTLYAQWDTLSDHAYVDLGLPSGTLWATCNVGAYSPEEYGDYFAWGETSVKSNYSWNTYSWCNGSNSTLTKYCNDASYGYNGYTDNLTVVQTSDDAATANWGTNWRMPTLAELNELISNCVVRWTIQNGVSGGLFTGTNGNTIFIPAAGYLDGSNLVNSGSYGYLWSSLLYTSSSDHAYRIAFSSGSGNTANTYEGRYYGFSVRPVRNINNSNESYTVTFNANGGSGTMQPQTFREGVAQELRTNTFTRTNYTFTGWNTAENGSGTAYTNGQSITVSANMTLYAQWEVVATETFTDSRDGNVYRYVTIGSQVWMAENLRYEGNTTLGQQQSTTVKYRYYPNGVEGYVANYGYLYNWAAAMNGANSSSENPSGVQGICPNGWHLPSDAEWTQLSDYLGGEENAGAMLAGNADMWTSDALTRSGYFGSTGFATLPAGLYIGGYYNFGYHTYFWSATESDSNDAYVRYIDYYSTYLNRHGYEKDFGLSVRCVRNN